MREVNQLKKGQAQEPIVYIVIAIVSMLVIIFVSNLIATGTDESLTRAQCGASVRQHTWANLVGMDSFARGLKCPAENVIVKKQKDDFVTKRVAFRQIGNSMHKCWKDFGRGQFELFEDEGIYCNICSYVEFEDKFKGQKLQNLKEFLAKEKPTLEQKPYLAELSGISTDNFQEVFDNPSKFNAEDKITDTIDTSNIYAIIFVYAKGKSKVGQLQDKLGGRDTILLAGTASSIGAGAAAGFMIAGPVGSLIGVGISVIGTYFSFDQFFSDQKTEWAAFTTIVSIDPKEKIDKSENPLFKLGCEGARSS